MEKVKNVLLIRGYGPIHEDRFQFHEERYAEAQGLHVVHPQDIPNFVPVAGGPRPEAQAFEEFFADKIKREGLEPDRTIVLAHSLGGNGWLRILATRKDLRAWEPLKNRFLKRDFCILCENAEARYRRIRLDTAMSDETFAAKIQKSQL